MQIFKTHKRVDIDKSIGNVKITSTHHGRPIEILINGKIILQ